MNKSHIYYSMFLIKKTNNKIQTDILTLPFISLKDDGVDLWFIQNKQKKKNSKKSW